MMVSEAIRELVIGEALASKENLEVACAVRASFDAVLRTILSRFLKQLEIEVATELGDGWITSLSIPEKLGGERQFFVVGKKKWVDSRPIGLGSSAGKVFIGIRKVQPGSSLSEKDEESLRQSLRKMGETLGSGYYDVWVAWTYVPHKSYGIWNHATPETLGEMYFDGSDMVSYFKNLIVRWARAASEILDRG